ncbi:WD40 repeat-like protein [Piedraia hortae CBS 480.64]|uniref:WD40 repeat-like protein n=1 Tax=Piedraia hortae CBS 480.64 TaxID=1314780 RepID=A0A6A7C729_9PEZI|nr:WD40 repeat-like protein [Piedraia hortae CBS 480.64]
MPAERSKTPPPVTGKRSLSERIGDNNATIAGRLPQQVGVSRTSTPGGSPSRKRQRLQRGGDRFIPNRTGRDLAQGYSLLHDDASPAKPGKRGDGDRMLSTILRSEMFDGEIPQAFRTNEGTRNRTPPVRSSPHGAALTPSTPNKNLFSYAANPTPSLTPRSISRSDRGPNVNVRSELYSLSPVKLSSQAMLLSPRKTPRQVSKAPYKVLDAPDLANDFYLNLVDWGPNDVLAVGLGASVYLWGRESGAVNLLCTLEDNDNVTSVSWIQRGHHLAVGTARGLLILYDTVTERRLRTMTGHSARVSSLAWNAHVLSTGSRDRSILHRDVRIAPQFVRRLAGHRQEVCGLKWNADTDQLASGGNDNKIFIWDRMDDRWLHKWGENEGGHRAAVKAIAWSPRQRGLLASGGGTADRCIKFWNTISTARGAASAPDSRLGWSLDPLPQSDFSGNRNSADSPSSLNPHLIRSHDTGSQVCNLLFSTLTPEIVSTHGYSQHAINIWKYPSMTPVASLTGHTYRVLYLSMSPDGTTIVTGAGDETLRFWDCFQKKDKNLPRGIVGEWGVIR